MKFGVFLALCGFFQESFSPPLKMYMLQALPLISEFALTVQVFMLLHLPREWGMGIWLDNLPKHIGIAGSTFRPEFEFSIYLTLHIKLHFQSLI